MNESQFLTSDKRMEVNSAPLFVAACPSFCMGHRLRNSDTLSLSVEAAVTFPGDSAPEFCAVDRCLKGLRGASPVPLGRRTRWKSPHRQPVAVVTSATSLVTPSNRRTCRSNDPQGGFAFAFRSRGHLSSRCAVQI